MNKFQQLKEFLRSPKGKKTLLVSIIIAIIIAIGAVAVYNRYFKKSISEPKPATQNIAINKEKIPKKTVSKLDGIEYNLDVANRHPIAIMVENHPEARPQVGLDKASLIYEVITEGGITRFMAVYGPQDASKVGPVRSARTYFLDWDLEYDGFYAHVGGNIDALDLIPQLGIKDLDQFTYGSGAYWREPESGKATEHTMYTDSEKLRDIAKGNGWNVVAGDFTALKFKSDLKLDMRTATQNIDINFSTPSFQVNWIYDRATNSYQREMAGISHNDRITGNQLTAKNIIVQKVNRTASITRINESGWDMDTVGTGEAMIFMDGKKIDATWKKLSRNERTKFYDPTGTEIEFNPGVTWYEIVPPDIAVIIS